MIRGLVVCVLLATAGCYSSDIDPMEMQQKIKAYDPSSLFDDGRAMRPPPPGTVPRERIVGNAGFTEGIENGRVVERIPLALTTELLLRGRKRFEITCAACHGILGDGNTEVARKMGLVTPPSLYKHAQKPPGEIFRVVTSGFGVMPSYAAEIPVEERWAVIAYVRALTLSQRAPRSVVPPGVALEPE